MNTKRIRLWIVMFLSSCVLSVAQGWDEKEKQKSPSASSKSYGQKLDKVDVIPSEWKQGKAEKITSAAIDSQIRDLLTKEGVKLSPLASDEKFIRRAYLDLTGKLPEPSVIQSFTAEKSTNKRTALIDKLLVSEDFNKHWARYWRDVVTARATEVRARINEPNFEAWLTEQIRKDVPWSEMVKEMITANGEIRYAGESKNKESGAGYFLLTHLGPDAINERAADTARVFMGIQIQCAQCHDHTSDIWKREQFHQLAAFYARTKDRPVREEGRVVGFTIFSAPFGEHRMPDKDDAKKTYAMEPKFLTGEKPKAGLNDEQRRRKLSEYVVGEENYWFHANMVNRVWADLMGQSFYNPVDNMGPLQDATYPEVLLKLSQHFRATKTDVRDLYRLILNTQAYQRELRLGESANQHVHFAGNYPMKLTADELWDSLTSVLGGSLQQPLQRAIGQGQGPAARLARRFGFEGLFKQMFAYDPTIKQDEVEASIPQALMLMNNPLIQGKMRNGRESTLGKILSTHTNDRDAVQALYLRVLARTPTVREEKTSLEFIKKVGKRNEAYEDLFWVLLNSAEFQTKR